jgi:hypothetical protein
VCPVLPSKFRKWQGRNRGAERQSNITSVDYVTGDRFIAEVLLECFDRLGHSRLRRGELKRYGEPLTDVQEKVLRQGLAPRNPFLTCDVLICVILLQATVLTVTVFKMHRRRG